MSSRCPYFHSDGLLMTYRIVFGWLIGPAETARSVCYFKINNNLTWVVYFTLCWCICVCVGGGDVWSFCLGGTGESMAFLFLGISCLSLRASFAMKHWLGLGNFFWYSSFLILVAFGVCVCCMYLYTSGFPAGIRDEVRDWALVTFSINLMFLTECLSLHMKHLFS